MVVSFWLWSSGAALLNGIGLLMTGMKYRTLAYESLIFASEVIGALHVEEEESGPGGSPDPDGDGGDFCRFLQIADLPRSQTNGESSDVCRLEKDKRNLSERAEKDESTEKGEGDEQSSSLCSRLQQTGDHDPGCGPVCVSDQKKNGEFESGDSPSSAELVEKFRHPLPLSHVRVKDFKRLDGFGERGPCDVCDGKYVHYIERMTKERQKTKRKAFRMCRTCYARAQQREAARCIALPGLIKTGNMKRWSVALGRCHLCDMGPIVWFDPVEHFGLCETCYAREYSGVGGAKRTSDRHGVTMRLGDALSRIKERDRVMRHRESQQKYFEKNREMVNEKKRIAKAGG